MLAWGKKGAGAARGRVQWHYRPIPATPELDDADLAVLVALLKQTIAADPLPLSPRIRQLRAILAKLEPSASRPQPYPAPKSIGERSHVLRRKRGRR